jgi:hypothetical protein
MTGSENVNAQAAGEKYQGLSELVCFALAGSENLYLQALVYLALAGSENLYLQVANEEP